MVVTFWHSNYEAKVRHIDSHMRSFNKDVGDKYPGEMLVTRLQAQFKAESLLLDVWKELKELLDEKGVIINKIVARLKG